MANRKWYHKKRFIIPIAIILFFKGCEFFINVIENIPVDIKESLIEKNNPKIVSLDENVRYDANGKEIKPDIIYSIESEEIYDAPIKTQVTRHIFISEGSYSVDDIRYILDENFQSLANQKGFEYHNPPSHYQIIVYPDKKRAEQKSGSWIGLLNKIGDDGTIEHMFNESIIEAQYQEQEIKFGLTEEQRQEVWQKSILAERKAGTNGQLLTKLEDEICIDYGINEDQRMNIIVEAYEKGWLKP